MFNSKTQEMAVGKTKDEAYAVRRDIRWMYVIYGFNYILPLLVIPYLTRVLGVAGWGYLSYWLAICTVISMAVEFGFLISGQRSVSRFRNDVGELSRLFCEVTSAKLLISIAFILLYIIYLLLFNELVDDWYKIFGILYCGVVQGFSLAWYFRGTNKIRLAAILEMASKALSIFLVVFTIKSPDDAWKYFYCLGVGHSLILLASVLVIARNIRIRIPTLEDAIVGLGSGINIFVLHATGTLFTLSSVFILGIQVSPVEVGIYTGADKIVRFLSSLFDPIRHALFPKISYVIDFDPNATKRYIIKTLTIQLFLSSLICLAVFSFAPTIINLVLGPEFLPATDVLRLLSVLLPILAINATLGYLWMLPNGFDLVCTITVAFALLMNLLLSYLFVPIGGVIGMATSILISEFLIVLVFYLFFRKTK